MNAWHNIQQTPPPAPGIYWCARVWTRQTGDNYRVEVHYDDKRFRQWNGSAWIGEVDFTHWHGEVKR